MKGETIHLKKMLTKLEDKAQYHLVDGDFSLHVNELLEKKIKFTFSGEIKCIASGEKTKKSYGQGYSYKSFISLAQCDTCMVRPELCHYHLGTCREPKWGEDHCFVPHVIYLSNTGHTKVGITREYNVPHRWIDQGATQALAILRVKDRKTSGLIEVEMARVMSDRTHWTKMLSGEPEEMDLYARREELFDEFGEIIDDFEAEDLNDDEVKINYPVLEYPKKVKALSLDKTPMVEGTLLGIKGQYLILDTGVFNVRKHQGYMVDLTVS